MLRISNLKCPLDFAEQNLPRLVAQTLNCKEDFASFRIVKKAIDARSKSDVHYVYGVEIEAADEDALLSSTPYPLRRRSNRRRLIVCRAETYVCGRLSSAAVRPECWPESPWRKPD